MTNTCTGHRYYVNPDTPEDGTDIRHDRPCPLHLPVAAGVSALVESLQLVLDELNTFDQHATVTIPRWNDDRGSFYVEPTYYRCSNRTLWYAHFLSPQLSACWQLRAEPGDATKEAEVETHG